MRAMKTREQLTQYAKSRVLNDQDIDNECCWGVAYEINDILWKQNVEEKLVNTGYGIYREKRVTFYPRVRDISINYVNCKSAHYRVLEYVHS